MTTPANPGLMAPVEAAPATPPVAGLTALARRPDTPNNRWQLGYSYRPEMPAPFIRTRSTVTQTLGTNLGNGVPPAQIRTIPVMLDVQDSVSTFDFAVEDYEKRAIRLIEAYTSQLLEYELWTGKLAQADNLPNRRFQSPDTINVTPTTFPSPQAAVALLMGKLSQANMGDGMIHASADVGIRLPDGWRNEATLAEFGFVVVSGSGYPGTGPDGTGTSWMYATDLVNVRLGEPECIPGKFSEAVDRASNTLTLYGQRVGAADFAGPVFACQVSAT